jgi:hypothetical protein
MSAKLEGGRRPVPYRLICIRHGIIERPEDQAQDGDAFRTFRIQPALGSSMPAGYSGTPLPKKLGITESTRVTLIGAPAEYRSLLGVLPTDAKLAASLSDKTDLVHVFVTQRDELARHLAKLRRKLRDDAALWVSWPKKTSKVATTVTVDVIRELALPLGFVDIKVCAVSEVWSGLKLVVRKELRGKSAG